MSCFKPDVLNNMVALITGGSSGIGFEIARQLGLHGCSVFISGRRKDVLDAAVSKLRAEGIALTGLQGDVRKQETCDQWVAAVDSQFGRLDILVNCAAGNFLTAAEELTPNGFKTVMEIDALGVFTMSRAAFPMLCQSSRPNIINISATLQMPATWFQVHASAAKSAIDSMTRTLALEWGHRGIRVNGIAPGPIQGTAGLSKLGPAGESDAAEKMILQTIPIGRMGQKSDIAYCCVYLSSEAATFITGDTLIVDGGNWLWKPQIVPRSVVSSVSRGVEAKSRKVGTAVTSKL